MKTEDILKRTGKTALAIGLLLVGILAALGEFKIITDHVPSTWHRHVGAILFIGLCVCAACLLLRRPVDPIAEVYCPRCMAVGGHTLAPQYRRSVNPLAWHFGGFFLSIFYSGSRQERFRCRGCNELFYSHTAVSRGYRLLFLLFVALIANYLWSELSEIWNPEN